MTSAKIRLFAALHMRAEFRVGALCAKRHAQTTFDCETEEVDVAKEFNLLPLIFEINRGLKKDY